MHSDKRTIGFSGSLSMRRALAVAACAAALGACAKSDKNAGTDTLGTSAAPAMGSDTGMTNANNTAGTATGATTGSTSSTGATVTATSDAEIMSVIGMANASEIGAGKLAETKATSSDVKSFARDMVKDHTAMQGDADKLAKKANITPTAPSAATQMKSESTAMMDSLKSAAKGATFDQQYIAGQVADHQKVLSNLQSYQGQAQNADLKNMIQQAIPKVQQHLDKARDIQGKLGTKA